MQGNPTGQETEHHVYFAVFRFGDDVSAVTRLMGIDPTKAWVKGQPVGSSKGIRTHSRWALHSDLPLHHSVEKHFDNLLPRLEERRDAIIQVRGLFDVQLSVVSYTREMNSSFQLSDNTIGRIARLRLTIDFDLYCLRQKA